MHTNIYQCDTDWTPDCWAVVTGASSGVGRAYARELAGRGFNIVAVARREAELQKLCEELKKEYGVKAEYICFDFGTTVENIDVLERSVMGLTQGNVAILVHMAGTSDLARHFTDKSLKHNSAILRLITEGTLATLQLFARMMCLHRQKRSAIITSGAISAYFPLAGYATSSANKAYVRALSEVINYEFREHIDVMCAHPIAVQSEILRNPSPVSVPASMFSRNTLNQLGQAIETNGCFRHDVFVFIISSMSPELRKAYFHRSVPRFAKLLNRPVDDRPVHQKLQDQK